MKNENQFIQTIFTMEGSSKKRKIDQEQKIQELEKHIEKQEQTIQELEKRIKKLEKKKTEKKYRGRTG